MRFEHKTFENETVTLDGNEFVNCTIRNCRIAFKGGASDLANVKFEGTVTLDVSEAAACTIRFLRLLQAWNPKFVEGLLASPGAQPRA